VTPPALARSSRLRDLLARFVDAARRLSESAEMASIQVALPPSFIGLGAALAVGMLLVPGTLLQRFSEAFIAAFGAMSALLVVLLADAYARRTSVPRALAIALCAATFAASLPYRRAHSAFTLAVAVGPTGLFLAIGVGLVATAALALGRRALGAPVGTLVASAVVLGLAIALEVAGVSVTGAIDAAISPLGRLGDSLGALLIIVLLETVLWVVGIHGPALLAPVILPIYIRLQLANTAALVHDRPLPHIVTVSLFLFVFPGGAGATLPLVAMLSRSRVKRVRRLALATLLPGIVNVNEPLMFGLPLVLNPTLGVPFVAAPLVLALVAYEATAYGFVARTAYYIPSVVPAPIGVFLATRDWRSVALVVVELALATIIYLPFVRSFERRERERDALQAPETA